MAYKIESIRKAIDHAENIVQMFLDSYRDVSDQEKIMMTYAIVNAVEAARSAVDDIQRYFSTRLTDEFNLNYRHLRNTFREFSEDWEDEYRRADEYEKPSVLNSQLDIFNATLDLLSNLNEANSYISQSLRYISQTFAGVDSKISERQDNKEKRTMVLNNAYQSFLTSSNIRKVKEHFLEQINAYTRLHGKRRETYVVYKDELVKNSNSIFLVYEQKRDVASYIIENSTSYTDNDIYAYFNNKFVYDELELRIMRYDYEVEASEKYRALFKNKAAEELAMIFADVLYDNAGLYVGNSYALVLLAMQDLNVINSGRLVKAFHDYVNNEILLPHKEDIVKDPSTLTKVTGKVNEIPFYKLDACNLKDSKFSKNEFDRFSDIYWLCVSIMNMALEYDLSKMGFADYLCSRHPKTPENDIFKDKRKIKLLVSVLNGEEAEF